MKLPTPLACDSLLAFCPLAKRGCWATYNWRLHHGEVVAINADHRAIFFTEQSLPPVGAKIGPVFEQPLHALGVIILRLRSWIIGVLANTIASPDEKCRGSLEWLVLHENGFILLKCLDAVLEVREEPGWRPAPRSAPETAPGERRACAGQHGRG